MALVLDTSTVAASDRADALHAAMSSAVPSRVRIDRPGTGVRARVEAWELGTGAGLLHVASTGHHLTRTDRHLRGGAPERISVALQLDGDGRLTHRGRTATCHPGRLQLVDLTSPFDFVTGPDSSAIAFYVDSSALGLSVDVVRRAAPLLDGGPLHDLAHRHLVHVRQIADEVDGTRSAAMLGTATVELVRALIASAAGPGRERPGPTDALFTRVTAYMRSHLVEADLDPARIAAAHHISVRYLHLLFAQRQLGVREWIVRERLEGARRHLVTDPPRNSSIAAIGRRWGFCDPGHFARRFRQAYGVSPREWRRQHHDR